MTKEKPPTEPTELEKLQDKYDSLMSEFKDLEKDLARQKEQTEIRTGHYHEECDKTSNLRKELEKAEDQIFFHKKTIETMIELHKKREMF